MRKETQAALLLLAAAAMIKLVFTGTADRYVAAGMAVPLVIAALILVSVAIVTLRDVYRAPRRSPSEVDGAVDPEGPRYFRTGWLLLIPVLALLVLAPPALGPTQASRLGTAVTSARGAEFGPLPDGDPVRLTLLEYAARAALDNGRTLSGRRVALVGFVITGADARPYLARMAVSCCALDAQPVKVGLSGDLPAELSPDQWIEVEGVFAEQFDQDPVNGDPIPYVQVVSLRTIDAPAEPYERRAPGLG